MKILAVIDVDLSDLNAQVLQTAGDVLPLVVVLLGAGLVFTLIKRWVGEEHGDESNADMDADGYHLDGCPCDGCEFNRQANEAEEQDADAWFAQEAAENDAPQDEESADIEAEERGARAG